MKARQAAVVPMIGSFLCALCWAPSRWNNQSRTWRRSRRFFVPLNLVNGKLLLILVCEGHAKIFEGIMLQEYSVAERKLIGERRVIFKGTAIGFTEGQTA